MDNWRKLNFDLGEGDEIRAVVQHQNAYFFFSKHKIFKVIPPKSAEESVPTKIILFKDVGVVDPLVARTVLQVDYFLYKLGVSDAEIRSKLFDLSWEVLGSLLALRGMHDALEAEIDDALKNIEDDIEAYTLGDCPRPLPQLQNFTLSFHSFAAEAKRAIRKLSEVANIICDLGAKPGHFHKIRDWASESEWARGDLHSMLARDIKWIETWIEIRNCIEHPKANKYVECSGFFLQDDRVIRLPTWRLFHPEYDLNRPQDVLKSEYYCYNNILKLFEDLLVLCFGGRLHWASGIKFDSIPEDERDADCPMRWRISVSY